MLVLWGNDRGEGRPDFFSRRRLKTEAAGIFPELIGGEENAPANRSSAGLADFPRMPPKGEPVEPVEVEPLADAAPASFPNRANRRR